MQLSKVLLLGLSHFSIDVKQTETKVTVVFSPKTTVTDPAVKDLKPLIINFDSPEEMDEKFVEMITGPVQKTVQLFTGIEDYEKQLAATAKKTKEADAEKKANSTAAASKKAADAKKKEEVAKATPTLEFTEETPVEKPAEVETKKTAPELIKEISDKNKAEVPVVEEAKVEEEIIQTHSYDNEDVVDATDQEQEEEENQEDLFSSVPDLFS
jgi:PRTRC genetic system protein E